MLRYLLPFLLTASAAFAGGIASSNSKSQPVDVAETALGLNAKQSTVFKFGSNQAIGNTATEDIWSYSSAGIKDYLALGGEAVTISSGSTDDDGDPAGDGAQTVRVYFIDGTTGDFATEDVTLDGTTGVPMSAQPERIYRMAVLTAGSQGDNAGIIYAGTGTVTAGVPQTKVVSVISAGKNQTEQAHYTVPENYKALGYGFSATGSEGDQFQVIAWLRQNTGNTLGVWRPAYEFELGAGVVTEDLSVPFLIPGNTDVRWAVEHIAGGGSRRVFLNYQLIVVED